jgi:hypothetical protein
MGKNSKERERERERKREREREREREERERERAEQVQNILLSDVGTNVLNSNLSIFPFLLLLRAKLGLHALNELLPRDCGRN